MSTETLVIKAEPRAGTTRSVNNALRKNGMIPGVIYGKSGTQNIAIAVKAFPSAHTASKTVTIDVGGSKKQVLMREVQMDTMTTSPIHVDFQEVSPTDVVFSQIPLEFKGLTKEQEKDASFKVMLRSVRVKATVGKMPERIEIEVGHLKSGDSIHLSDVKVPEGVTLRGQAKLALATLSRI